MFKKGVFLFFLTLLAWNSFGQSKKYTQLFKEDYDNKRIHFGMQFGFSTAKYFVSAATIDSINTPGSFGFNIGGTINYALSDYLELRSGLNVALYSRKIAWYNPTTRDSESKFRESTWLEIPMLVKFRSLRRKNHRAFLIGGAKFGWESNKRGSTDLMGNQIDLSLEYGFGFEKFNKYFKFTPEIRFSNGILNLYAPTNGITFTPRLVSNTISLILNFE